MRSYLMSLAGAKVPTIFAASTICLALGAGAGVAVMYLCGYQIKEPPRRAADAGGGALAKGGPGAGGPARGGPGAGGPGAGGFGGGPGGGPGAGRGPSAKAQLAVLVVKL